MRVGRSSHRKKPRWRCMAEKERKKHTVKTKNKKRKKDFLFTYKLLISSLMKQ